MHMEYSKQQVVIYSVKFRSNLDYFKYFVPFTHAYINIDIAYGSLYQPALNFYLIHFNVKLFLKRENEILNIGRNITLTLTLTAWRRVRIPSP
jgi:hypothetical protein